VSWRPWATRTCGTTSRERRRGSRPGCLWRAEADGPDNEVGKSPEVEVRNFLVRVNLENSQRSRLRNPSPLQRAHLRQVLVNEAHCHRAFPYGRSHPLDRLAAHIAHGEDTGQTALKHERLAR
jgi:hypothetical protein